MDILILMNFLCEKWKNFKKNIEKKKKKNALKDGIVPVFCLSAPAIFLGFWPSRGIAG